MHMRTKKWAKPELEQCPFYMESPSQLRGKWRTFFPDGSLPLDVELGCGKGVSTAKQARTLCCRNLIAVDISTNVLGDLRRNVQREFAGDTPHNIAIVKHDIENISDILAPEDSVSRVYISFPNPWSQHTRHLKRRLTHPRQLMQYRQFMAKGGEVWFKTDDDGLFADSREYFRLCGFSEKIILPDLHNSSFQPNFITEHEARYSAQGIPVKFGIFVMEEMPSPLDPVEYAKEERRERRSGEE